MPLRPLLRNAALCALVLLGGCATTPPEPVPEDLTSQAPPNWSQRADTLMTFDHWTLTGKIAVSEGEQRESAVINRWRQSGSRFDVQLSSAFLGLGTTVIKGSHNAIWLTDSDGETYYSEDPEQLMYDATGWHLPLGSLSYWVRGVPAPDSKAERWFTPEGLLARFRQNGWTVQINRHHEWIAELPQLPRLLTVTRDDVRIRLAVTQWQPDS